MPSTANPSPDPYTSPSQWVKTPGPSLSLPSQPIQLAIHALPLRFLLQDEEELFPYLRQAILNAKVTLILSARYLNPSKDSMGTEQPPSAVVTIDPQHIVVVPSGVVIVSQ